MTETSREEPSQSGLKEQAYVLKVLWLDQMLFSGVDCGFEDCSLKQILYVFGSCFLIVSKPQ